MSRKEILTMRELIQIDFASDNDAIKARDVLFSYTLKDPQIIEILLKNDNFYKRKTGMLLQEKISIHFRNIALNNKNN